MCADSKVAQEDITFKVHENITGFDIPVNLALRMKVFKPIKSLFQNGGDQSLILEAFLWLEFYHIVEGSGAEEGHDKPKVGVIDEAYVITYHILVSTGRHDVYLLPNVIHVSILKML